MRKRMSLRQIEEARVMRETGMTWQAIADRFDRSPTQVRHYLGVLVCSRPKKPRVYLPRPPEGSTERERQRRADVARMQRYRARIFALLGLPSGKHRSIVVALHEEAARKGVPLGQLRLEQGVPTLTQLKTIQQHLELPSLESAMEKVREDPKGLLFALPELKG